MHDDKDITGSAPEEPGHRRHHHGGDGWRFRSGPGAGEGWEFGEEGEGEGWRGRPGRRPHFRGGGPGRGFSRPAFGFPGFPPGPGGAMPPWPGEHRFRGGRARRGDVRAAALALLAEGPMNGYQIIQEIGDRSGGLWRPSPGSVYPALAQLEDENLITAQAADGGRRAYVLTDEGRTYAAEHADELRAPWSDLGNGAVSSAVQMRKLVGQVHMAAFQVLSAGTDAQVSQATAILAQARKALYRLLAEDDEADGGSRAED